MSVLAARELRYGVRKHFWTRRKQILRGVDFEVERGELFGFLGPNGAGKTTTIKALLGLLAPDSGAALIFGRPAREREVRRRLGFMPERAYFPEHLTARELLVAHGVLAGLGRAAARRRADELLARVGLGGAAGERLRTFSKGMQQRVGLAQALVGDPELVILDEPMSGLDPLGRHDVRELLVELRGRGTTVFFSTHIIPDVEAICDRVAMLVAGSVRRVERLDAVLTGTTAEVEILAEGCSPASLAAVAGLGRTVARGSGHEITTPGADAANRAIDQLRAHGARILTVQTRRLSLEQIFVAESARGAERAA